MSLNVKALRNLHSRPLIRGDTGVERTSSDGRILKIVEARLQMSGIVEDHVGFSV